jgi:hypothetical protein
MKRDVLAMGLVGVLLVATLATAGICYWYLLTARNVRAMQGALSTANRNQQVMQALAIEVNEYAKRNRAIIPLLEDLNLRQRVPMTNAPAATTGGSK